MNELTLRPVREDDIPLLSRFAVEPGLIGDDWLDFRDAGRQARRLAEDGYPGAADPGRHPAGEHRGAEALVKAGFQLEGVVRAAEFRAGEYRDGLLYSRLRSDPAVQW